MDLFFKFCRLLMEKVLLILLQLLIQIEPFLIDSDTRNYEECLQMNNEKVKS